MMQIAAAAQVAAVTPNTKSELGASALRPSLLGKNGSISDARAR